LSLIIWALILGPLGALLAVPATLLVKSLLVDHADRGRWLGVLLNATPDEVDPEHPVTDAPDFEQDTHGEPKPAVTQEAGRPEQRSGAPSGSG
jgi:AI-2 transport protein TqsA